jgi:hypothetical protein
MAQEVKQLIAKQTGKHHQYHMMYFNNLDAPLPPTVQTSVETLLAYMAGGVPGYDVQTWHWLFGPIIADTTSEVVWHFYWLWLTADEAFEHDIADYGDRTIPLTTQEHDENEPVALLSEADTAAHEGHSIKICTSIPGVIPVGSMPFRHVITDPSWKITAADPPSYLVSLPNQIAVETKLFVDSVAVVDYQICTRYCDHNYLDQTGQGQESWETNFACASKDY